MMMSFRICTNYAVECTQPEVSSHVRKSQTFEVSHIMHPVVVLVTFRMY